LSQQDFSFANIIPILIQTLSSMVNNEKSFFEAIKKVFIVLIIVAIVYTWFLWCKEKPIRFLYSLIIFLVLYFVSQVNAHHNEIY
jgi:hypothetical protein